MPLLIVLLSVALAREPVPDPFVAVGLGGSVPAQQDTARATVQAGDTVTLRAVLFGGQRAWCMNPERHAPVGRNTTIDSRGLNGCSYTVSTPGFHRSGRWSVARERYGWTAEGARFVQSKDPQRVTMVVPDTPGELVVSVTGEVTWKLDSVAKREQTDRGYGTIVLTIEGQASKLTAEQARALLLRMFHAKIPEGTTRGEGLTWVASPGFANNLWALMGYKKYDHTACGGYQDKVLRLLDDLRNNGSDIEKSIFDHFDYGPIHAYYGGHQAVVLYPKGTDWDKTGLVLDPWPEQKPTTYGIADWKQRFSFGVGPSSVYRGLYPLTGGASYPTPAVRFTPEQVAIFRGLPEFEQSRLRALSPEQRARRLDELAGDAKRVAISVHSPVKLLVRDEQGRRVGYLPNGSFVYEIPGTDVDLFPSADGHRGAVYFLPERAYDVFAYPERQGTFDLSYVKHRDRPGEAIQRWQGLTATPGAQTALTLRPLDAHVPSLKDRSGRIVAPTIERARPRTRDSVRDAVDCSALSVVVPGATLFWMALALVRWRRRPRR
ncbi:MAG: hypothetical protein EA397_18080 [Deltaproteobacteria bacterium]|nr:MAG: hypothetical protein EA397_18080 [Deltaproteobacteria bacterium]